MKADIDIHIFVSEPDEGTEWVHRDWFYALKKVTNKQLVRFGKLYRSRSATARAANKLGKAVHWYPI